MRAIIVTGTDTGIGKTVFAAGLAAALRGTYWKPIQSGLDAEESDSDTARRLGVGKVLPEAYRLTQPLSPHRAAELDGIEIDPARLTLPDIEGPVVIEGAGGLLVPVTRSLLLADLFAQWRAPAVLVARTALGTINHSLLSAEAMRAHSIPILGIAFVGEANEDNEATICSLAKVKRLGRLPRLDPLNADTLSEAFAAHFRIEDFG
jgi:dethiobiotin synthetase